MKFLILTLFKDFLASLGRRFKYSVAIKAPKKLISRTCIIGKDATSKRVQKPIFSFQLRFKSFAGKGSKICKMIPSLLSSFFCCRIVLLCLSCYSACPCILYTKEKRKENHEKEREEKTRESKVKTSKTHSKCNNRNLL